MKNEKKEDWEKRLEVILTAFKTVKASENSVSLMVHDFPVWKLGKDWEVESLSIDFPNTYTGKPKDNRLNGLVLFS